MCGIAGFWTPRSAAVEVLERTARRMASALHHRGPDDQGTWADLQAGIALGHRRLAIIDLTEEGRQPMHSADGRYVLVYNGEIYNFQELGHELSRAGHSFRGHSDTEVLLAGFCEWGIAGTLKRSSGMFALAVWDREDQTLHLARDRAGEKPLYYGWAGGAFVFGSELKALRATPHWRGTINRQAVASLTRYGYIPSPLCIYDNIYKLQPGTMLTMTRRLVASKAATNPVPYWSLQEVIERGAREPSMTPPEAVEKLESLLSRAVRLQMVADVPLGAFLSGGIDSSAVVALMQAQSRRPIKTFSIGFASSDFDEAPFARAVAKHLGTDHTELYVQPEELRGVISTLPTIYDEPFADASQIPTILLCKLARSQVTVSLSGDAGDELFGGYEIYRRAQRFEPVLRCLPLAVRSGMAKALHTLSGWGLDHATYPGRAHAALTRAANVSDLLATVDRQSLHRLLMSPNRNSLPWLKHGAAAEEDTAPVSSRFPDFLHEMMARDFLSYLPDDVLVKVDRAAMSVSLETRVPLLDHRVVEFAWTLPKALKQRQGQGKWVLRQMLNRYVPAALVDRPKRGFGVPMAAWLRGPLRPWAEDLLAGPRLQNEGFYDAGTVRTKWKQHLSGKRDFGTALWHVLTFQSWLEQERASAVELELATDSGRSGDRERSYVNRAA